MLKGERCTICYTCVKAPMACSRLLAAGGWRPRSAKEVLVCSPAPLSCTDRIQAHRVEGGALHHPLHLRESLHGLQQAVGCWGVGLGAQATPGLRLGGGGLSQGWWPAQLCELCCDDTPQTGHQLVLHRHAFLVCTGCCPAGTAANAMALCRLTSSMSCTLMDDIDRRGCTAAEQGSRNYQPGLHDSRAVRMHCAAL